MAEDASRRNSSTPLLRNILARRPTFSCTPSFARERVLMCLFVEDADINTAMTIPPTACNGASSTRCRTSPRAPDVALTYAASTRYASYGIMSMAKAALECWTRELACHLGPEGHRVNAISSGPSEQSPPRASPVLTTSSIAASNAPLRRNVTQSDVAGTTLWLSSPPAGVTGQVIHVEQVIRHDGAGDHHGVRWKIRSPQQTEKGRRNRPRSLRTHRHHRLLCPDARRRGRDHLLAEHHRFTGQHP